MAHTMDMFAAHEPYLVPSMDPFAVRESHRVPAEDDDFGWLALEDVIDNWAGWLDPVNPDHTDAATTNTSRPTPPSLPPLQPAPIHLTVAPIAEDDVDQSELAPPSAPSLHPASKGEKCLRPKLLTMLLRSWMERCPQAPYASLEEKKMIAAYLSIPVAQVTNFANNYRKRFLKVGTKLTSYRELVSVAK